MALSATNPQKQKHLCPMCGQKMNLQGMLPRESWEEELRFIWHCPNPRCGCTESHKA